ncbi:unnamed protein product [Tilletia controversa]|uniref:Protein SSUH2 homolog n=3 Tax=Tilletia TaxID=13289 RepID=A0A8X7SZB6_9BASI|nr:hypothetical protein CF328_g4155 [Tilletia controversa]KAE8197085.1 hypothetical protein CF335_g4699 [Tilletia laevis]KAE8256816.1 hypothetical protein A4X03_0g5028 [Tilletia caries]KAE8198078.1 hypothetical protein CF336_g1854 [Tilletia laevis]KAE8253474.1 hypothetical protein A4X06_0g1431 [Tilletia controversa]
MTSFAPAFVQFDLRPKSSGGIPSPKPFGKMAASSSGWKSATNSPRGSIRGSRLPWSKQIDTIEESGQTPNWITFCDKDLVESNPDQDEIREKLVSEFPFLLEAEYAMAKASGNASRPRLFSFASAPSILASSDGLPSPNSLRLSIIAAEERRVMRVRLVTETRALAWRPISAITAEQDSEEVKVLTPIEALPGAWSLKIDTRATAQHALSKGRTGSAKRTFELEDLRTITDCGPCHASSQSKCGDCGGIEAASCFWCSGSGRRRGTEASKLCTNCNGHGQTFCAGCNNTGKKPCQECEGKGKRLMGLFVDVKMSVREMPAISLASLRRSSGTSTPVTPGISSGYSTPSVPAFVEKILREEDGEASIQALAGARIAQLAEDFAAAQEECVNPAKTVLAICEFERSSIHTVVVSIGKVAGHGIPSPASSSGGSPPSSIFLSPTAMPSTCKSPAPSSKSSRNIFRRRSAMSSPDVAAVPTFWTFKVASCPGVPPVQIA